MRFGVLSDVHGNLAALEETVRRLGEIGVDQWLCAGDLVGYGPQPNECVAMVIGLGATCVAGNHELALLGTLPEEQVGGLARVTLRRARVILRTETESFLAALPLAVELPDGIVMAHGSLSDPTEYVQTGRQAEDQLRKLREAYPAARLLILGHTHHPRAHGDLSGRLRVRPEVPLDTAQRYLLNPGSVGQSRRWEWPPRARAMVLDTDPLRARFVALEYDVASSVALLRSQGLSRACVHHPRNPVRAVARRAVRLVLGRRPRPARRAGSRKTDVP